MQQFFAFIRHHIWPAAGIAAAALIWGYGVVSDAGEIAALLLSPWQWQMIGGGAFLVSVLSILFQWHKVKVVAPGIEPAKRPAPTVNLSISTQNQSGGITAQTVNVGHRPRAIAQPAARDLRKCLLTVSKDGAWDVVGLLGDSEAFAFAEEIHQFVRDNGLKMQERCAVQGAFLRPVHGLSIQPEGKEGEIVVGTNTGLSPS